MTETIQIPVVSVRGSVVGGALFVWGYVLVWFLVNDRLKLLAYWLLIP